MGTFQLRRPKAEIINLGQAEAIAVGKWAQAYCWTSINSFWFRFSRDFVEMIGNCLGGKRKLHCLA